MILVLLSSCLQISKQTRLKRTLFNKNTSIGQENSSLQKQISKLFILTETAARQKSNILFRNSPTIFNNNKQLSLDEQTLFDILLDHLSFILCQRLIYCYKNIK